MTPLVRRLCALGAAVFCADGLPAFAASATNEVIRYNRDIRPILSENCFVCHGPDKNNRKKKLRLDVRENALEREAFVPGKPDQSELVKRVFNTDPEEVMPPPDTHKTLTAAQKDLLKRWIADGAQYEPHWAYIAPVRSPAPAVKQTKWVRNPIDAFVLANLEAKNVQPSPEADKRRLIRRLSLDLLGLPPTPEQVEAFVKDKSSGAYERLVDQLLKSPHFGERMAVPWLDQVRFADTVGYHGDQNVNVFPYRDYVINAFNQNKRFDQFTIEQIAGDLLPNPTTDQIVATGFNRLNMMTREGGAQAKEYLAKYAGDRARTISTAWLGSTMGCAECHDHKFDPFTARDFYSMEAFFADVRQWGVYMDYAYTPNPDFRGYSNDHPFPPEKLVESPYLKKRIALLNAELEKIVAASVQTNQTALQTWSKEVREFLKENPTGWNVPAGIAVAGKATNSPAFKEGPGNIWQANASKPSTDQIEIAPQAGWLASLQVEALPSGSFSNRVVRSDDNTRTLALTASVRRAKDGKTQNLGFYHADSPTKDDRYYNGYPIIGLQNSGWRLMKSKLTEAQRCTWLLDAPIKLEPGDRVIVTLKDNPLAAWRISSSPFAFEDPRQPALTAAQTKLINQRSPDSAAIGRLYLASTASDSKAFARFKELHHEILECRDGLSPTLITVSQPPMTTRILPRGNWQDESGEIVEPNPPLFLVANHKPADRRLTRLDLAKWLVAPENPLVARNFVNRLWKQFYGAGICNTVEELGAQGETPSHPELLDWLAVEFRESGWDIKHMVRLMVTSATYRQDSKGRPDLRDVDPNNRWLAAQNPRRLDAEFVRDNALGVAGLLTEDIGGPSAFPYQPAGYYVNIQFPDRDYIANRDLRQYRRGVYMHWQRTFLHPMLANFDAPSREECIATRSLSNTPQQALTLLNDPEFVEAARGWAQQLLAKPAKNDGDRINTIYLRALAREPQAKETESLVRFLEVQREYYRSHPEDTSKLLHIGNLPAAEKLDQPELAAWTTLCRVVLNLHETITRY